MSVKSSPNRHAGQHNQFSKLPALVLLGLGAGVVTAGAISLFRFLIELPVQIYTAMGVDHSSPWVRFMIPVIGAALFWLFWRSQNPSSRRVGVPHLYEHLSYHHGELPMRNLFNQLIGAALAIGTGQPVGREGPGVHIGAAISSWLGLKSGISYNHQRLLFGCGSAAAIAALFNTPLAGVLFAMEVILLEYSLAGFTAIIVAAISADSLTRHIFGNPEPLGHSIVSTGILDQIPVLVALTLCIGFAGLIFQQILVTLAKNRSKYLSLNIMTTGVLVGLLLAIEPNFVTSVHHVMQNTLELEYNSTELWQFTLFYLLVPPIVLGLGIPGGLIGPSLTAGALIGALLSVSMGSWGHNVDATTLSLIGMAAMLSAVIHAPLAALLAVFELSGSVQTLTLAMTVIVLSDLMMRSLFRMPSIFERLLTAQGLSRDTHLYRRVMMSSNVRDLMDDSFHDHRGRGGIDSSIESNWHLVDHEDQHRVFSHAEMSEELTDSTVDSASFCSVDVRSSLLQALDTMQREGCERLIVTKKGIVQGVLSQKHIEDFYRNAED